MSPEIPTALREGIARLQAAGIEPAEALCGWLLADRLACARMDLPLLRGRAMSDEDRAWFEAGLRRLEAGEPLAYVLGHAEFRGRRLAVDPRVLIPRPETEQFADLVLACEDLWRLPTPVVADVGTGSGCLAITLALDRPQARILALDADPAALELARANASRWQVGGRITFIQADLLGGLPADSLDAVVANLPYIPTRDLETLDRSVRDFEPRQALDGGPDGLALVRRLLDQAPAALRLGGRIFLEIGFEQGRAVQSLLEAGGWGGIRILQDLAGLDRFALASRIIP
jgi:release factor glutamine methyltransferase